MSPAQKTEVETQRNIVFSKNSSKLPPGHVDVIIQDPYSNKEGDYAFDAYMLAMGYVRYGDTICNTAYVLSK